MKILATGAKRHHRFAVDGTWDQVLAAVQVQADADGEVDWRVSLDSTIARVHQQAVTASSHTAGDTAGGLESQESAAPATQR